MHDVAKTWRSLRLGGKGIQRHPRNFGPMIRVLFRNQEIVTKLAFGASTPFRVLST
jgi:hypothetical protein